MARSRIDGTNGIIGLSRTTAAPILKTSSRSIRDPTGLNVFPSLLNRRHVFAVAVAIAGAGCVGCTSLERPFGFLRTNPAVPPVEVMVSVQESDAEPVEDTEIESPEITMAFASLKQQRGALDSPVPQFGSSPVLPTEPKTRSAGGAAEQPEFPRGGWSEHRRLW